MCWPLRLLRDCSGATSIEYALIASLVSIAIVGALSAIAPALADIWPPLIAAFG